RLLTRSPARSPRVRRQPVRLPNTASGTRASGAGSSGQPVPDLVHELLGEARYSLEVIDGGEAVLALAIGDHASRLRHGHAELPELLEGRLVDVDGRAAARLRPALRLRRLRLGLGPGGALCAPARLGGLGLSRSPRSLVCPGPLLLSLLGGLGALPLLGLRLLIPLGPPVGRLLLALRLLLRGLLLARGPLGRGRHRRSLLRAPALGLLIGPRGLLGALRLR